MNFLFFAIGLAVGFGSKFAFDEYAVWKAEQKKTYLDMEKILVEFRAIELLKEKNEGIGSPKTISRV